jgi:MFS family permease
VGGFITTYFSWRWNFLLNVPLGLAGIAAAQKLMPADPQGARRPLDLVGLVLLTAGLAGMLYALEDFAGDVGRRTTPLLLAAAGAALLFGGLRHLRRTPHPLLELSSYSVPTFYATNGGASLVVRATVAATPFLLPLLLQLAFGLTALRAGTFIMIYFIGNLAMKPATTPLLQRFGFRRVLIVNGALSGIAIAACGWTEPLHWPVLSSSVFLLAGLTRSMQFTCMNTLAFADLSRAQRGPASTLNSMLVQVATALGVATAAILLQKSTQFHGSAQPNLSDFRLAFALVGAAGFLAALGNRRLHPDAGAAVTGHAASG